MQRTLSIGSYATAWAMLHRLRSILVRPGRERLTGTVEVDETFIGGVEPGLAGGRAKGKKVLVGIAVEVKQPRGFGRVRMQVLPDASAGSLHPFITESIEAGSRVVTDGWNGYLGIDKHGYVHERRSQRAALMLVEDPGALLPGVHRVAALVKRWLVGTHQGAVNTTHLPAYLNEFVFRFNRRHAKARGLLFFRILELAVGADPVRFTDIIANPKPKRRPPHSPGVGGHPRTLDRPRAQRPWRDAPPIGPDN